jgi:hypothetical protein
VCWLAKFAVTALTTRDTGWRVGCKFHGVVRVSAFAIVTSFTLAAVTALGACGKSAPPAGGAATTGSAAPGPVIGTDRTAIELPGDANGIVWDATSNALYIADGASAQIEKWSDGVGFTPIAQLPHDAAYVGSAGAGSGSMMASTGKLSLGGLARVPAGFVTTSFGFGTTGTVFVAPAAGGGAVHSVPGLDPARRRLGLAQAPDGTLYDGYVVVADGKTRGGVARLDLATGETDLADVAGKPVGVLATGDTLFVSDQDKNQILAIALATPAAPPRVVAHDLPSVDLLARLPNGDLITGGKRGVVTRVDVTTGAATPIANHFDQVRGVAYDPVGKRLFVVEHSRATKRQHLYIVAYDAGAKGGA